MKLKQLESLRRQHDINLKRKANEEPNVGKAISLALISGQQLKLRPIKDIIETARKNIADCSCYSSSERSLKFSQVFDFESKELAAYKKAEDARYKMVSAYSKKAEKILRRAELDEAFEATEASDQIAQAAYDAGLID